MQGLEVDAHGRVSRQVNRTQASGKDADVIRNHFRDEAVIGHGFIDHGIGKRIVVARIGVSASAAFKVVTNAIAIEVRRTVSTANTQSILLIAITITVSVGNVRTAAFVDGTRTIADSTGIHITHAVIHIIADAIAVRICRAVSTAHTGGIELVAIAVTVSIGDRIAPAFVRGTGTIADTTFIDRAHAIVHIVADAIFIGIRRAISTTHSKGVLLIAVAIAVASRDWIATAIVDGSRAIADAASIIVTDTVVHVVTDAVIVRIGSAITTALAEGIVVQAVVSTAATGTAFTIAERQGKQEEILVVPLREDLHVEHSGQVPIRGELTQKDQPIGVGEAIGISVEHVPDASNGVIHNDVASGQSTARVKAEGPILVW